MRAHIRSTVSRYPRYEKHSPIHYEILISELDQLSASQITDSEIVRKTALNALRKRRIGRSASAFRDAEEYASFLQAQLVF